MYAKRPHVHFREENIIKLVGLANSFGARLEQMFPPSQICNKILVETRIIITITQTIAKLCKEIVIIFSLYLIADHVKKHALYLQKFFTSVLHFSHI